MEQSDGVSAITDDMLVNAYLNIRNARAAANSAADKVDREFKAKLDRIEGELLKRMRERNNEGFRTEHGTVYREEDFKPSTNNWNEVYQWVMEDPDRFELLEKRLKKTFVKEFMEHGKDEDGHLGPPPPGVNVLREYVARVRVSNK